MDSIIITGCFGGLGQAITMAVSKYKPEIHLLLGDKINPETDAMIKNLNQKGLNAHFYPLDIRCQDSVNCFFQNISNLGLNIIGAVNNAGICHPLTSTSKINEEIWTSIIDTNLNGTWRCLAKEISIFRKTGEGRIVNISSVAGLLGSPGLAAYAASKAAIISLTKTASLELAKTNIRINTICPGFIDAGLTASVLKPDSREMEYFLSNTPDPRLITTDEFTSTVNWLLFEAPKAILGQAITIDNGISIQ